MPPPSSRQSFGSVKIHMLHISLKIHMLHILHSSHMTYSCSQLQGTTIVNAAQSCHEGPHILTCKQQQLKFRNCGRQCPLLCYDAEDSRAQHRDAAKVHELHISIFSLQVADAHLVASCKSCLYANRQMFESSVCANRKYGFCMCTARHTDHLGH